MPNNNAIWNTGASVYLTLETYLFQVAQKGPILLSLAFQVEQELGQEK